MGVKEKMIWRTGAPEVMKTLVIKTMNTKV